MSDSDKSKAEVQADWGPRGTVGVSFAAALEFDDVHCRIGERDVLNGVDFTLSPGEIVCLLGESGSGKSTILRAAAGIQPITGGRVLINRKCVSDARTTIQPDKRGVGLMFQDFALFPHMSVLENAIFGLKKLGRREALKQARQALKRVGLADRENDYPAQLSGGQQQRLALARAVAPRPGILLLDEPFSSLDARLRQAVRSETLAVLRETGATSLIVTHDPEEAMLLGDRIALLRAGRIIQIDRANDVYDHPVDLNAARFLSHLSEVEGEVRNNVALTPIGPVPVSGRQDGQRVIIGIRPVGAVHLSLGGDGAAGRIVSRRDALGVGNYEVLVAGVEHPIRLRRQAHPEFVPGRDVYLSLDPAHVLVFDAD
ncbi:ABC transporter ATP-binding protein [Cucumibacter marinus]|uniref:ABC transporter ATP-binding protein n=1 Tax=Cucumibacter marinus TaxID=1121252 RepID=UPI00041FED49|nr:ABC transporter ATP-binding protein [Cucumibacter marinus]